MATKAEEVKALAEGRGCLGRSQDDEPVFILCARDKVASHAVRAWAWAANVAGAPQVKTEEALELANLMDVWRASHGGGKVPD